MLRIVSKCDTYFNCEAEVMGKEANNVLAKMFRNVYRGCILPRVKTNESPYTPWHGIRIRILTSIQHDLIASLMTSRRLIIGRSMSLLNSRSIRSGNNCKHYNHSSRNQRVTSFDSFNTSITTTYLESVISSSLGSFLAMIAVVGRASSDLGGWTMC